MSRGNPSSDRPVSDLATPDVLVVRHESTRTQLTALREANEEYAAINGRMNELLTGVTRALKGPPPPLTSWSWHDLPEVAEAAMRELDELRCQVHGHDWVVEPSTSSVRKGAPMMVCSRRFCDEIGWRVDT